MKKKLLAIGLALALSGCATPTIMLKNESTGQVERCGGGAIGSVAGGLIGYGIEKAADRKCVRDFEAKGFTPASSPIWHASSVQVEGPKAAPSRYMFTAERMAKANGCESPVATMNYASAGMENFSVVCTTGEPRSIRCEQDKCRTLN